MASEYSTTITGIPFMYFESKQVAKLLLKGLKKKELPEIIEKDNLFQYTSTKSIEKRVGTIYRRIGKLDPKLLEILADGPAHDGKIIVLLSIMKQDKLFLEFIAEVVREKLFMPDSKLTDADFAHFFDSKKEASSKVAGWTEKVLKKLKQVYIQVLVGSGMLNNKDDRILQRLILDSQFKSALLKSFDPELISCIER